MNIMSVLEISIFGNAIWQLFAFCVVMVMTYPLAKFTKLITSKFLIKWAEKTSFRFDDILISSLNPPINMFILAGLFYLGGSILTLQDFTLVIFEKVFNFLIIIPIVYFLIKFSTGILEYYLLHDTKRKNVNQAAIGLLMSMVRIGLFALGILLILGNLGYDVTALVAGLGVGGLAFALAAQDILKNFFAGISLIFDKTFNKGERVNFQGHSGKIEELKLRTTKLRTYDGTLLTIPNAQLSDNIVENVTKVPKVKVSMVIGLEYSTSTVKLKKAKEIIEKAIKNEKLADHDNFWVYFDNFGPYSLDIQVIYYGLLTQDDWPDKVLFKERINFEIKEKLEKAGIGMAFPTQTIELKK